MPFAPRPPTRHRAGLRRRLAGPARALRAARRWPTCSRRAVRYADVRVPGVAAARRQPAARSPPARRCPRRPRARPPARRPGDLLAGPGAARTLRAIAAGGRDGFYGGEFGAGSARPRRRRVRRGRPGRPAGRLGRAARPSTRGATASGPVPPQLAGLPHAGRRRGSPTASTLPDDPDDPAWAHLLVEAAVARPATTGRPCSHEDADGAALLAARPRSARAAPPCGADAARSAAMAPAAGRRHHLPLRRRRRRHGRLAHPVERVGLRQPPVRAGDRHQPPQPRHRLLPRARPSRRVRAGPPAAAHAGARSSSPGRTASSTAVLGTQGGDGQPQILLQVARPACCRPARRPAEAIGSRPLGARPAPGQGFDTWTATGRARSAVEDGRPRHGPQDWLRRGHDVVMRPAFEHRVRPRPCDRPSAPTASWPGLPTAARIGAVAAH